MQFLLWILLSIGAADKQTGKMRLNAFFDLIKGNEIVMIIQ